MKKEINNRFGVFIYGPLLIVILLSASCKKYFDARPDQKQVVPSTATDLQSLLDNVLVMNRSYPSIGEAAADNYYVTLTDYNALTTSEDKSLYIWQRDGVVVNGQWLAPYEVVYYANQVLESLNNGAGLAPSQGAQLKGEALFFRGYAFFQVASLFAPPYNSSTAGTDLGIPLRLTADFNRQSLRASNRATYQQIIMDLRSAAALLPVSSTIASRPNKVAAYGALARVYLAMGDYSNAGFYADSCLSFQPPLLDYNTLSSTSPNPIARLNKEVIFYAMSSGSALLVPSRCKIDSALYQSYAAEDLRKTIFFKSNGNGTYAFKGNYDGSQSSVIFTGMATDEIYLIAAECAARSGQTTKALADLNQLLQMRWKKGQFVPIQITDPVALLSIILTERRKELIFRGLRWTDLRRLNQEAAYKAALTRNLGGVAYTLPPNDLRYTMLIPQEVITTSGMQQNPR